MKRVTLCTALLLAGTIAAFASPDESFDKANSLYESSRFEGAAVRYRELLQERPRDPVLHFNLGNAYFKIGQPGTLGLAIASYLRAFNADPRDPDILYNLELALQRAGDTLVPSGSPKALFMTYHCLSAVELAALHWIFLWAALLMLAAAAVKDKWRSALTPWLAGAIFFWTIFGGWWGMRSVSAMRAPAVIVVHDAEVRSGPGTNFPVSFKAPEGRRVSRLDARGTWVEIGIPKEGLKGWVSAESIESL